MKRMGDRRGLLAAAACLLGLGCAAPDGAAREALEETGGSVCTATAEGRIEACEDVRYEGSLGGGVVRDRRLLRRLDDRELPPPINDPPSEGDLSYGTFSPAGYGHYCSMRWANGGWAAAWDTTGKDPCAWIEANADPGGVIERAGMFSSAGLNRATMRCTDGSIYLAEGWGPAALSGPFTVAAEAGLPGCVLTVAPRALPIFTSPFTPGYSDDPNDHQDIVGGNGHDFAQQGLYSVTPAEFGLPGRTLTILNHEGEPAPGYVDDHLGKDYGAPDWTPIYPAMRGRVLAARWYGVPPVDGCVSNQGEVWMEHVILRNPALYSERFITAYAHVVPGDLEVGAVVTPTDEIAAVAPYEISGCSSASHLHFDVVRVTNTSHSRQVTVEIYEDYEDQWGPGTIGNNSNSFPWHIDPYGFNAPMGFDPWAWKANAPFGALSIDLWEDGAAPPAGGWAPTWTQ